MALGDVARSGEPAFHSLIDARTTDSRKKNIVQLTTSVEGPFGSEQTIYLCGTSHVSQKSCEDVRDLIQAVKPEVVMLELCEQRRELLRPVDKSKKDLSLVQHLKLWRENKQTLLGVVYTWMLSQVAEKCEIDPGEEFRVALLEAIKINAKVSLGDRPVSITLARTWAALTLFQKTKFVLDILCMGWLSPPREEIETLLKSLTENDDVISAAMKEFAQQHPQLIRPLIEERDLYMIFVLRRLALQSNKIVAVVGAGHLKGIQEKWDADIDIVDIMSMPKKSRFGWSKFFLVMSVGSAAALVIAAATTKRHSITNLRVWRSLRDV